MGWKIDKRNLINHKYNCVLVCPGGGSGCHLWAHAHPEVMISLCIIAHGWENIERWIANLPFRSPYSWHRGILSEAEASMVVDEAGKTMPKWSLNK